MGAATEMKFGTRVAYGLGMMPKHQIKARDSTLDDEK